MSADTPNTSSDLPPRRSVAWLWLFWVAFMIGAATLVLLSAKPLRALAREDLPTLDPRLVPVPAHLVVGQALDTEFQRMPTRASVNWQDDKDFAAMPWEPVN